MQKANKNKSVVLEKLSIALRQYNYRAAVEKVLFTMIGLWLALALNNWNDKKKKQVDGQAMLSQINLALQQDISDIRETVEGYQFRARCCQTILQNLNPESVLTDSLQEAFESMEGYSFLTANKGAYETLKSRGVDLIQNDSIRLRIATLYEVEYVIVEHSEDFFHKIYSEQITPYLFGHFEKSSKGLQPVAWDQLRSDHHFRYLTTVCYCDNQHLMELYQYLQKAVTRLTVDIDKELHR